MLHYKHHEVSFIPFPFFSFSFFSSFLFLSVVVALQSGVKFPLLARKFGSISQYVSGCRSIGSAALCSNQSRFSFFLFAGRAHERNFICFIDCFLFFFFYKTWNFLKYSNVFLLLRNIRFCFVTKYLLDLFWICFHQCLILSREAKNLLSKSDRHNTKEEKRVMLLLPCVELLLTDWISLR